MEVAWILIPFALFLGLCFLAGFFWMTNSGQYDDLDSPPLRMLLDDKKFNEKNKISTFNHNKEEK